MVGRFLQGLRGFGVPPWLGGGGGLFPGSSLFSAFRLSLFGSLPFSPVPPVSLRPGGCLFPWGKRLHNGCLGLLLRHLFPWGCVLCFLSPVSLTPLLSWFCFLAPSLFSTPSVSPSVVFLWGLRYEVTLVWVECRLWVLPLDRNEGLACWSRIPSGWGHPLGQVCFAYTLDHDRRITFGCWFLFLWVVVPYRVLLLAPCFPLVGHHRLPLCYSYLPCVASFCSVGFLLLASFPCFALLCPWPLVLLLAFLRYFRLLRPLPLSLSLSLVFLLEIFGWSSSPFVAFCYIFVLCSLVGSSPGGPFSSVSGFSSSYLGVLGGLPRVLFSSPAASLSSLSGPLAMSGFPACPLPRSFLSSFWWLCLSSVCSAPSFSCPGFTVISLVLPLSPRVPFRSLSRPFFALPRGIFSYTASSSF